MSAFLAGLFSLSLGGAAVVLLLWAVGALTRQRWNARWRCAAWLLLCVRLAVPLTFQPFPQATPLHLTVPDGDVQFASSPGRKEGIEIVKPSKPEREERKRPVSRFDVLFLCWGMGTVGILTWHLFRHWQFCRWVRRWSGPIEDPELAALCEHLSEELGIRPPRLRLCPGLTVPMAAGLFRPSILLPETLTEAKAGILCHELNHLRRRDIYQRALLLWVCALHWFNPFIWAMAHLFARDMELACDEDTVKCLTGSQRWDYAQAILNAGETRFRV